LNAISSSQWVAFTRKSQSLYHSFLFTTCICVLACALGCRGPCEASGVFPWKGVLTMLVENDVLLGPSHIMWFNANFLQRSTRVDHASGCWTSQRFTATSHSNVA
jgi:hypothetical protein